MNAKKRGRPFDKGNPGRPKGAVNKSTASVKEGILLCYEKIGGDEAFAQWAKEHPTEFYTKIYKQLLPIDLNHSGKLNISVAEASRRIAEVFGGGSRTNAPLSVGLGSGQEPVSDSG